MEQEQEFSNETESFTFADYPIVKYQIQRYYYSIIENHRKYRELRKRNKKDRNLKIHIQTLIETLYGLMENYESIKKSKESILYKDYEKDKDVQIILNTIFKHVGEFEMTNKIMSDETLILCIRTLRKAHVVMGLGNIESEKPSLEKAMIRT
jgi:putative cell wall-binding protein|tara:strand:+ start:3326 stop:3781 length:456 start_codon:yes stop_codon:yes gene_type:complete